jgi:putative acetyltransferase
MGGGASPTLLSKPKRMKENRWPKLRPASNNDCEKVTSLVYGVLAEYNLKPDPQATDIDLSDIEHFYIHRGGIFYVLEEKNGSIIGAYGLYPIDQEICELRKMYLHRSYRGKGWGKFLLEHALSQARKLHFKRVTLETASVLKEAISLYRSYGFVEYQAPHLSCRCDQAYVLELR